MRHRRCRLQSHVGATRFGNNWKGLGNELSLLKVALLGTITYPTYGRGFHHQDPATFKRDMLTVPRNRRSLERSLESFTKTNFHTLLLGREFACVNFPGLRTEFCSAEKHRLAKFWKSGTLSGARRLWQTHGRAPDKVQDSENYGLASLCFGGTHVLQLQMQPVSTEP